MIDKLPCEPEVIFNIFNEISKGQIPAFALEVRDFLNPQQASTYILKILNDSHLDLEVMLEKNTDFYDEWFEVTYGEVIKDNPEVSISDISELSTFMLSFTSQWTAKLVKFTAIPHNVCKNLVAILMKLFEESLFDSLRKLATNLIDLFEDDHKVSKDTIDLLNQQIRKLQDQLSSERKLNDEKSKEKSEIFAAKIELESKYERVKRELKNKEKEHEEMIKIENQKLVKMESYYESIIKDKETHVASLEGKIDELNRSLNEINKNLSSKSIELNRENTKLAVELEQLRGKDKSKRGNINEGNSESLQGLFKTLQSVFMDFKESVDKLDKEKENLVYS